MCSVQVSYLDHSSGRLREIPERDSEQAEQRRLRLIRLRAASAQDAAPCRTSTETTLGKSLQQVHDITDGQCWILTSRLQSVVCQAGSILRKQPQSILHRRTDILRIRGRREWRLLQRE